MKLEHDFTVPAPVDEAWKVLLDVERIAPCMPGATLLNVDGDSFTGSVKVKVGPIQVTYKGEAKFAEKDETAHRAVIEASGKEARGSGTASATVTAVLTSAGPTSTKVAVETDLNVTGRPAQFGRGVMAEVGAKLIGQFANCLAEELASPAPPAAPATSASTPTAPAAEPPAPDTATTDDEGYVAPGQSVPAEEVREAEGPAATRAPRPEAPPIDLLEVAGGSVAKRLAPVAALVALVLLVVWRRRRR
ncbi:MAG: SRPBCC family protein [Frankiales bacterium]|nr:SRPBCC family protein [Frankiales bacterium]